MILSNKTIHVRQDTGKENEMRKEFFISGNQITVENAVVKIKDHKITGNVITELKDAPADVLEHCKEKGVDFKTRVYFGGAIIPREVAEEVLIQESVIMAEKKKKLDLNVPGLEILRKAINDAGRYYDEFNEMMDDEFNDGVNPPAKPTSDINALKLQYHRAAAYITAESWENASNYAKSAAGAKAKRAIEDGVDAETAIKSMESEWSKYCNEHMFD